MLVFSLDLSSAFGIVNIKLVLNRLKIVGLPSDEVDLVEIWLNNIIYFVGVAANNSILCDLLPGTVKGSILGTVLCAIFIPPLFDIEHLPTFAEIFMPRSREVN
jgi:hypothetical protein